MADYRVTVEDLDTGDTDTRDMYNGDYLLLTFGGCYLHRTDAYPTKGTHVLTIKGHAPHGRAHARPGAVIDGQAQETVPPDPAGG